MRIRTIKPEFWTDKRVAGWDVFTRLTFIGLLSAADDYGRGSAEPAVLAAALYPFDLSREPIETLASVSRALATLSREGRIKCYTISGESFYEVVNWRRHQRVDKPGRSRIPTPSAEFDGLERQEPRQNSARVSRESRETSSRLSRLDQGSGIRDQGSSPLPPCDVEEEKSPPPEAIQQAESILAIWPKKIDPTAALAAILRAVRRDGFERVRSGTVAIAEADRRRNGATSPPGRFLPRPAEFFDSSRYLDDPEQYGPRTASADPTELRRQIDDLSRMLVEHPGNPDNLEGSLDRKASHRDEFRDLKRVISEKRAALAELLKGQEAEQ